MATANVATWSGRTIIWNKLRGSGTEPKNIGWGLQSSGATAPYTDVNGSLKTDVNLFAPATETRVAGTSTLTTTTQLGDTYQVVGTLTCLVGGKTIQEAGLFDVTTLTPTTTVSTSMTAAQTSVLLGAAVGSSLATSSYYRQIESEVVLVTAGSNSTTETIVRGALGSTSAAHSSGVATTIGGDGSAGTAAGQTTGEGGTSHASAPALGGSMFAHADFAGIALNVSDSINFTFLDQLS